MATSRAECGIAGHVLVVSLRTRDCLFHLIDGLEARPTGIKPEACPTTAHEAPTLIDYGHKTFEKAKNTSV